jgi:hypothetical protein
VNGSASDDYSGPKSPLRVMQIVELLAAATHGMSLAAMTEALQMPACWLRRARWRPN